MTTTVHNCTDRRANNMSAVCQALAGIADDADAIAKGTLPAGMASLVANKARRLIVELEGFKARDLVNMRKAVD